MFLTLLVVEIWSMDLRFVFYFKQICYQQFYFMLNRTSSLRYVSFLQCKRITIYKIHLLF